MNEKLVKSLQYLTKSTWILLLINLSFQPLSQASAPILLEGVDFIPTANGQILGSPNGQSFYVFAD